MVGEPVVSLPQMSMATYDLLKEPAVRTVHLWETEPEQMSVYW